MDDIVKKLHPHEKKILLALKEMGSATTKEIAEKSGLPEESVHKAGLWAKLKGLLSHEDEVKIIPELLEEGKKYIKTGMPEYNLLKKIPAGGIDIKKLRDFQQLDIALMWAKKNGWIEIKSGSVFLTENGKKAGSTDFKKIIESKDIGKLRMLESRRLIRIKEKKIKTFVLSKEGEKVVPSIKTSESGINILTEEMIKTGSWKGKTFRPYDANLPAPRIYPAKTHPYIQFVNQIRAKMMAMGFKEAMGPYVELQFWNCDALFMPSYHPARGIHDVFELKTPEKGMVSDKRTFQRVGMTHKNGWITGSRGWGSWDPEKALKPILRSHTTAVTARTLASGAEMPGMYFTIGRNFRPDVLDASHLFEFDQCDSIIVSEHMTFRHLLGILKEVASVAGIESLRFLPSYFPFTEPSVEIYGKLNNKWMEFGGAGIFRPEVTRPLGVDVPVLAWAFGLSRLAMIKLGLTDIRDLFSPDLGMFRKSRLVV
jgi:phenylalanyl-tRNA synthetase alpha chain